MSWTHRSTTNGTSLFHFHSSCRSSGVILLISATVLSGTTLASCCITKLNWPSVFSTRQWSIIRGSKLAVIWTPRAASVHCNISPYVVKACNPDCPHHVPNFSLSS
ncbi:hypothetical protein EJ02DRAFT_356025 [Clathrospora elynae]|uniref:Uncharacterized protein n=1 Tax=Clathrospora elynae TaxID=706981 RepID=A0A6A5SE37_9PLEO|nr:hypothetical protein EJ02DRAFT_356025 [Clathrospora elynae]